MVRIIRDVADRADLMTVSHPVLAGRVLHSVVVRLDTAGHVFHVADPIAVQHTKGIPALFPGAAGSCNLPDRLRVGDGGRDAGPRQRHRAPDDAITAKTEND